MITIRIATMKLSNNDINYYVQIINDGRLHDVRMYGKDFYNRALYERDHLAYVLLGEPEPCLWEDKYADLKDIK